MSDEFYQMVKGVSDSAVKPLCKLIDAVRAGAGLWYEPIHLRRMAKSEGDALILRAEAKVALTELKQRAAARLTNTETRRQQNIESIVEKASQSLPEQCSETPVDQDWMAAFFDCCKDVGNDDVQKMWGKLLSGEVAEPGSYSRRALDALRLMSRLEASLFKIIGFRVWKLDDWPILFIPGGRDSHWPTACPFTWNQIAILGDIGLVEAVICDEEQFIEANRKTITFDYHGQRFVGKTNPSGTGNDPSWVSFSTLGTELLPLVAQKGGLKDEYFNSCCKCLSKKQWELDTTSEFQELIVPDDVLAILNLTRDVDTPE